MWTVDGVIVADQIFTRSRSAVDIGHRPRLWILITLLPVNPGLEMLTSGQNLLFFFKQSQEMDSLEYLMSYVNVEIYIWCVQSAQYDDVSPGRRVFFVHSVQQRCGQC